jgi:hypothetical protein
MRSHEVQEEQKLHKNNHHQHHQIPWCPVLSVSPSLQVKTQEAWERELVAVR